MALLSAGVGAILCLLVLAPLVRLVAVTLTPDGLRAWQEVAASELSRNLLWRPIVNTLAIGLAVGAGATLLGSALAWLVVLTDVPGRRLIGVLASVPFILPSFAVALAWEAAFRNGRVGGHVGLLQNLGLAVPDWIAWGIVPVVATLIVHYYSLTFALVAAALAAVNADLLEAGAMTGASQARLMGGITLPLVLPAVVAAALLGFAEGVSNFAAPAILGLPVRFHTLSTRLFGAISIGQVERGYVLSVILIAVAGALLLVGTRLGGRRSFAVITGKGSRYARVRLGRWRWPACGAALAICGLTAVAPGVTLLASSFLHQPGAFAGGWTTHYWLGPSSPEIAQGQPGILRNPQVLHAAGTTLGLGAAVAVAATVLGVAVGYCLARSRVRWLTGLIAQLSYLPILLPGIALGAAFIAQFARPLGPLPPLYGTFAILVVAGAAYTLPFASQAGRAAVAQVSTDLEEASLMAGATLPRRFVAIVAPLVARGMLAAAALVFVKIVRDLSLMLLLMTPTTPLLSVVAFRYASEGFVQFANAITTVVVAISVGVTWLARRLQRSTQPWMDHD
ncbi:MAG: iron ABC transporter permease [Armatimonadota bacterium]|nr:iron ABC transporter permease [Armatimonadota bacterium]MDR7496761.1 iron ABC transporter permease [Armatimonadota bacterium]MDR7512096.1 iron ABC transporter permease [Armatimonadota bacterium]